MLDWYGFNTKAIFCFTVFSIFLHNKTILQVGNNNIQHVGHSLFCDVNISDKNKTIFQPVALQLVMNKRFILLF